MKITGVETFLVGTPPPFKGGINWGFVRVTTDEGIVGWGELNGVAFREKTLVQLVREYADHFLIGIHDPFDIERLWGRLYGGDDTGFWAYFRNPGTLGSQALAAIEMACWDIIGKAAGQPVYNLLGGRYHARLRSYSYLYSWVPGSPPEQAGEEALVILERGFTAIKFDPIFPLFPAPRSVSLAELKYTDAVMASIRDAVGSRLDILIGTHGQLNTHGAIRFARMLEPYDPLWFEEPVPLENKIEMGRIARSTTVPIATGERLVTKWDFQQVLENQAAQIIQVNVGLSGILEARKIAGMAEAHYAQIAPWMYCGPVSGAASVQVDVCSPNFLIQEGIEDWGGFSATILKEPIRWEAGYIIPSDRPGLGVEPDERELAKHPPHDMSADAIRGSLKIFEHMGEAVAKYA
ncbi:MAG TPA: mandelate racemase/muconate lactonizing enzyme family protein [Solirubrobacteraceae bacterium]|nr:mandelate racemase/muconate lactonizing enzyme family protein [Solirubrobacteraceae bacterium]